MTLIRKFLSLLTSKAATCNACGGPLPCKEHDGATLAAMRGEAVAPRMTIPYHELHREVLALTGVRDRLLQERDEAHAKYRGAIEANEEWHREVIKLRAQLQRIEGALQGTPEATDVVYLALRKTLHMTIDVYNGYRNAKDILAALRSHLNLEASQPVTTNSSTTDRERPMTRGRVRSRCPCRHRAAHGRGNRTDHRRYREPMSLCAKCGDDVSITFNDLCGECADKEPGPPGRVSAKETARSLDRIIRRHLHADSRKKQKGRR